MVHGELNALIKMWVLWNIKIEDHEIKTPYICERIPALTSTVHTVS